jgi:hypothetical protein
VESARTVLAESARLMEQETKARVIAEARADAAEARAAELEEELSQEGHPVNM